MENIGLEFAVEVKNRFNGLQLAGREPEELWNDIRGIVKDRDSGQKGAKIQKEENHEVAIG